MRARSRTSWRRELACLLTLASAASADATSPEPAPSRSDVHVTVDEARYARRPAAAARPADVSRADYLETIERFLDRQEKPQLDSLRQSLPYPDLNYNLEAADHFAFVYRVGGDQANADLAMAFIERAHRVWSRKLTAPGAPFVPRPGGPPFGCIGSGVGSSRAPDSRKPPAPSFASCSSPRSRAFRCSSTTPVNTRAPWTWR